MASISTLRAYLRLSNEGKDKARLVRKSDGLRMVVNGIPAQRTSASLAATADAFGVTVKLPPAEENGVEEGETYKRFGIAARDVVNAMYEKDAAVDAALKEEDERIAAAVAAAKAARDAEERRLKEEDERNKAAQENGRKRQTAGAK